MKTRFHICALAFFLCACTGENKQVKTGSNDTSDIRQVAGTSLSPETPGQVTDSITQYHSEDLRKFGLRGRVKSVRTQDYSSFVTCLSGPLSFDEDGVMTNTFTDFLDNTISYNAEGYVDKTECRESDGTSFSLEFTGYDSEGRPLSGIYKTMAPDGEWKVNFSITYTDIDKEGNWIGRQFEGESATRTMKADGSLGREQKETFSSKETRVIAYYR